MAKLRHGGMITETDYTGKSLEKAKEYAEAGGYTVRIVENNGTPLTLDMSVREDRINFRVKNGVVTAAFGG